MPNVFSGITTVKGLGATKGYAIAYLVGDGKIIFLKNSKRWHKAYLIGT